MNIVISADRSVCFLIGGPLCGFLCTALYPAQVPGRTKLYLLLDGWSPVGLESPFFSYCHVLLRAADSFRLLPSVTLLINQVLICLCCSALGTKKVVSVSVCGQRLISERLSCFPSL